MTGFLDDFNSIQGAGIMDILGDDITFVPNGGTSTIIKASFTKAYYETESRTESSTPAIECLASDVPNYNDGSIIFNGITYNIDHGEPDGKGMIVLMLKKPL